MQMSGDLGPVAWIIFPSPPSDP